MHARLSLIEGEANPNIVEVQTDRPISIGRSRDNSIVIPRDEQTSRLHARVYWENGHWLVRDFGLNGTRINNNRITEIAEIPDGSELRIGGVKFRFSLSDQPTIVDSTNRTIANERPVTEHTQPMMYRFNPDEMAALHQFMTTAVELREAYELARLLTQTIFYHTGASQVGLFNLDPTEPLPKVVWPDSSQVEPVLSRQLTRRVQREERLVWLAEDTTATRTASGVFSTNVADALAAPLGFGRRSFGAIHAYKKNSHFSERDGQFVSTLARFCSHLFIQMRTLRSNSAEISRLTGVEADGDEMLGDSPAMKKLRQDILRAASMPQPVLFMGEGGVGKEMAAHDTHVRSTRSPGPFVLVRTAAIPATLLAPELFGYRKGAFPAATGDCAGLVAQADEGTLYIDEIADLPMECQDRLLKLITTKTYRSHGSTTDHHIDVRVMVGTQHDWKVMVQSGQIRAELWDAFHNLEIAVPPLRAHSEDIPHLAQFYLDRISAEQRGKWQLTPEAMHALTTWHWPGNIRQLQTVIETLAINTPLDTITEQNVRLVIGP
jgi:two-component system response regulator HydG